MKISLIVIQFHETFTAFIKYIFDDPLPTLFRYVVFGSFKVARAAISTITILQTEIEIDFDLEANEF